MTKRNKLVLAGVPVLALIGALVWYLSSHPIDVLDPAGPVASKERALIVIAVLLSVIVVIPVYLMTIIIAWRYRENNPKKTKYRPDWDHSLAIESIWWGIPLVIITILSVITWDSSHALDPYKPLSATGKAPVNVQVIALNWKWLFIYPDYNLASVNQLEIPTNTPINFYITSDTVMNSFWVPQLGSQIYAMPGMVTQLHLQADKPGSYDGWSANISGLGFANMHFKVNAVSSSTFQAWKQSVAKSAHKLTSAEYANLSKPNPNVPCPVTYYSSVQNQLFGDQVIKYMSPYVPGSSGATNYNYSMEGME